MTLHLIKPLGFSLADRYLKRAGLDYWDKLDLHIHENLDDFLKGKSWGKNLHVLYQGKRKNYAECQYGPDDFF